ncbi:MAG: tetratricopeptide repeat protein [Candidatus Brocadiales bacterium]|nr:tetratricopeptide repeat protein [Candidatus Bathyanammoxibius amoris]
MSEDPKKYLKRGDKLSDQSDYHAAIRYYNRALKIKPKYIEAWYGKGLALYHLDSYDEAIKYFDKVMKIKPKYALAGFGKCAALYRLGRYEEAIEYNDKVLKITGPKHPLPWYGKSIALYKLGRYKEAEQAARKAANLGEDVHGYANNWGDVLLKLKQYDEAENTYLRANELKETWHSHLGLAKVYIELGDELGEKDLYEDALENLNNILKLGIPGDKEDKLDYYFQRGYTNAKLGNWKEAERNFLECKEDPKAKRNIRRIKSRLKVDGPSSRKLVYGGWALAGVSVVVLSIFCVFFFISSKNIDSDLLKIIIPISLFFIAVGVCLPYIRSLKGPAGMGFEKEISIRPEFTPLELKLESPSL